MTPAENVQKSLNKAIISINIKTNEKEMFSSITIASIELNINLRSMSAICRKKKKKSPNQKMTVKNTVLNLLNTLIVALRLSNLIIKCKLLATKILTKTKLFSETQRSTKSRIPNLNIQRIQIETRYSNGKNGASVIETPFLFSFLLTERLNQETNQLTGY